MFFFHGAPILVASAGTALYFHGSLLSFTSSPWLALLIACGVGLILTLLSLGGMLVHPDPEPIEI